MQDGFVKVAAVTPEVRVADVAFNVDACVRAAQTACTVHGAMVVTLPELCLTAYTCEDLFWQDALLSAADKGLADFARRTADLNALLLVGLPVRVNAKLYNCCAVVCGGTILGVVPKRYLPTYNEFYEGRHFVPGITDVVAIDVGGQLDVPFGTSQLFACDELSELVVAVELCEDLWVPNPPSVAHAMAGATLVCNLSASNALVGKADYRRDLVRGQSARLLCGYVYASAGTGESTQDVVFSGHDLVCENGRLLAEGKPFGDGLAVSEVDVRQLAAERRRMSTFDVAASGVQRGYHVTHFSLDECETRLTRYVDAHPFVPADPARRAERCEDVFNIQAHGLAKRLAHTHSSHAVIGISGGLDSTLALLVTVRAFDLLDLDRTGIIAVTMPGFGTTDRTHDNATKLSDALGVDLREVNIGDAVRQHFSDIGHDESVHDVTYENSQARERTQILMDIANELGGIHVGTEDMSEFADGWCTYNGDHISMYDVNAGSTKTMVQMVVRYVAETTDNKVLADALFDVLDTPVSPELLPPTRNGEIAQKSEDSVGPYNLQDFFLYYLVECGFTPEKVLRLADIAYGDEFDHDTLKKWLRSYCRRLFSQQFKRSCLQDGPTLNGFSFSPRTGFSMPSDGSDALYLATVDALK